MDINLAMPFPHIRMMPPPIAVAELPKPDVVLITHAHTDHMDPDTLGPFCSKYPDVMVCVPKAALGVAHERMPGSNNIVALNAGDELTISDGFSVKAFPSAHEDFDQTEDGLFQYLGYIFGFADIAIYHSGDTVHYEGLASALEAHRPQVALLPINGRDEFRYSNGVPGNMNAIEAVALCEEASIPALPS